MIFSVLISTPTLSVLVCALVLNHPSACLVGQLELYSSRWYELDGLSVECVEYQGYQSWTLQPFTFINRFCTLIETVAVSVTVCCWGKKQKNTRFIFIFCLRVCVLKVLNVLLSKTRRISVSGQPTPVGQTDLRRLELNSLPADFKKTQI